MATDRVARLIFSKATSLPDLLRKFRWGHHLHPYPGRVGVHGNGDRYLFNREVVGYAMATHMRTSLPVEALKMGN